MDSDDEFLPNAFQILFDAWNGIPETGRKEYFEVIACCIDQHGDKVSELFPENINDLPNQQAVKLYERIRGDHTVMCRSEIMKENPWPEPAGITFVTEGILWYRLRREYKSCFINDFVLIIHTESDDSLSRTPCRTIQVLKNYVWSAIYQINNRKIYFENRALDYCKAVFRCCVFSQIIRWKGERVDVKPVGVLNRVLIGICWVPAIVTAWIYVKKRMNA